MDKEELFENRKKKIYELMQDKLYQPMKEKELAVFMDVAKEDRHELRMVLRALMDENKIEVNARGKYKVSAARSFTGTFVSNARALDLLRLKVLMKICSYRGRKQMVHMILISLTQSSFQAMAKGRKPESSISLSVESARSSVYIQIGEMEEGT